jgi:hypothetical protein
MSIKGDIEELKSLDDEIKRLSKELSKLRRQKREAEERVALFLKSKDLPGAKLNNTVILVDSKPKHTYKSAKQKSIAVMEVLKDYGLPVQEVMERLSEASRKETVESNKIKFKAIRK